MAPQHDESGVPFAIAYSLQHFRLLELPPDLAALLDAPSPPRLSIKSQAPSSSASASASTAYAVLCTPNKTFQLRQVATSNSLFVTQPVLDTNGATDDIPAPTTCAIASCTTTLELHPSDASAASLLKQVLPLYDIVDGEVVASGTRMPKASIVDDLPLSDAQCEDGWRHLMAFELDGSSYRPSANALSVVWKSINAAALAEGVKLDSQFMTADIANAVAEEGHPSSLVEAILRYLAPGDQDTRDSWSCLDRSKTVAFVGKALLEAKPAASDYLIADFTDTWEDYLPEIWRKDAQLTAIEGAYEFPTTTSIRAKNKPGTGAAPALKSTPAARKWHEKFGKTRKK